MAEPEQRFLGGRFVLDDAGRRGDDAFGAADPASGGGSAAPRDVASTAASQPLARQIVWNSGVAHGGTISRRYRVVG